MRYNVPFEVLKPRRLEIGLPVSDGGFFFWDYGKPEWVYCTRISPNLYPWDSVGWYIRERAYIGAPQFYPITSPECSGVYWGYLSDLDAWHKIYYHRNFIKSFMTDEDGRVCSPVCFVPIPEHLTVSGEVSYKVVHEI